MKTTIAVLTCTVLLVAGCNTEGIRRFSEALEQRTNAMNAAQGRYGPPVQQGYTATPVQNGECRQVYAPALGGWTVACRRAEGEANDGSYDAQCLEQCSRLSAMSVRGCMGSSYSLDSDCDTSKQSRERERCRQTCRR